ncbi:MAG: hypothetical protein LWX01_12455 [Deltaproteobacteria bacterium]|nr:hypothetical protein [Deltaproteobacteria bacterium]MDL1962476.1 hypothetical protein [Deltaproteobacteria bacterium]
MSRDNAYVLDILLMAKDAIEFTKGVDKDNFLSDRKSHLSPKRMDAFG